MKLAAAAAQKFLRSPDPAIRAALLFGPNGARVADAAEAVIAKILGPKPDPYALTRFSEDDVKRGGARLLDELAAQSLLGASGPRVVRVRIAGDAAADGLLAALAALEGGAPAAAFLLVEAGDLAARSKVRAAFEKATGAAALAFYEDAPADLAKFAAALAKDLNLALAPGGLETVITHLPNDRGVIRAEFEKLALYAHGLDRPVQPEEALDLISGEADAALDEAARLATAGDAARAVETLARSGAGGITALKAVERRLLRLASARASMAQGASPQDAIARLRPPVLWKEKDAFLGQLRRATPRALQAALDVVWAAQLQALAPGAPSQELLAGGAYREVATILAE